MRKHFLLLFLMALLPLAGWATQPGESALPTKPTLLAPTWNGEAQALVAANSWTFEALYEDAVGGIAFYAVVNGGAAPTATTEFTKNVVPTATAGGKYDVYYKILADGDQYDEDGDWTLLGTTKIKKLSTVLTAPTAANLVYHAAGQAQELLTAAAGLNNSHIEVQYRLGTTGVWTDNYENIKGTNAGDYTVLYQVTETENYTGADGSIDVSIAPLEITGAVLSWDEATFTYDGTAQTPTNIALKSSDGNKTYTLTDDYTLAWSGNNKDAGNHTLTATFTNNYSGSATKTMTIAPLSIVDGEGNLAAGFALSASDMTNANASVYTGTAITPTVVLRYNGAAMTHSVLDGGDYARSYNNNINASNEAEIIFTAKNNFTGAYTQKFTINQASLADVTCDPVADVTYKGADWEPEITNVKLGDYTLRANTDYTVGYSGNLNAGAANAAKITLSPVADGNFKETKEITFTINKADLKVTPVAASKNLGTSDPAFTYITVEGYGLLGDDATKKVADIIKTGEITVTRDAGESAGDYNMTIASTATADNYNIVPVNDPVVKFTINHAGVTIAAKDTEKTYGYRLPTLVDYFADDALGFTATGLANGDNITKLTFTVKDANGNEKAAGTMLDAGTYTITPSAAEATSDSYTFSYAADPATLTINPYKLKIEAQAQTIDYGNAPTLTISNSTVKLYDLNKTTSSGNEADLSGFTGVTKESFIDGLTWTMADADPKPIATPGDIVVNLKDNPESPATQLFKNFDVTTTNGAVSYNPIGDVTITIPSDGTALDMIQQYAGQNVKVKINFSARARTLGTKAREWQANTWVTMTLPFDISVADLSKALGYAIVNVIDPGRTEISGTGSKFYGKLTMKGGNGKDDVLAANKPFMVKTADAITGTVKFGTQTIVAPENAAALSVKAGKGAMFTGTYTATKVDNSNDAKFWFLMGNDDRWAYIPSTVADGIFWNIVPFEGFIDMTNANATASAPNMTFYFEEIDGSTTAIKSINADSLNGKMDAEGWYTINGIKLESAPTQKGVYIKDGKKVVIK